MKEIFSEYGLLFLTGMTALGIMLFVACHMLGTEGVLKNILGALADGLLGG